VTWLAGIPAEALATFALASALIEVTPGPNMTWLAVVTVSEGRPKGYAAVAGVFLGLFAVGVASSLGLAALMTERPAAWQVLRWAGIAYLVWLAWDAWRAADGREDGHEGGAGAGAFFRRGLVTNLLNPKAALFFVSVLPAFTADTGPLIPQTLVLTAFYVAIATTVHAGIVTLAGTARALLTDREKSRTVRRALAVALFGVAVWFAWTSGRAG
jgi:threonine/homoserine/homoserine lactone efflux protein